MTIELSTNARLLSQQTSVEPQIILEIDGFDAIFGAQPITKLVRYGLDGLVYGLEGVVYGGVIEDVNSKPYITLQGTTRNISQQIQIDKKAATSVSRVNISMIDKNNELSTMFSPNQVVEDPLSRKCTVYLGFVGGCHPDDSIAIFQGILDSVEFDTGICKLGIAHPDSLKRQSIFLKNTTLTNIAMDAAQTTVPVLSTKNYLDAGDTFSTYVKVDDEIIKYTGRSGTSFTGCTRGQLNTIATTHDLNATVDSFYRITGGAIDMALKVMLSGSGSYANDIAVTAIQQLDAFTFKNNSFKTSLINAQSILGFVLGDYISITGATIPANNVVNAVILSATPDDSGTIITLDTNLETENTNNMVFSVKSKYDVLPIGAGMGMTPREVDVDRHEFFNQLLSTSVPDLDFYLRDDVDGKDFIENQVYFVSGVYSLPRGGKSSVNATLPPLAINETKTLDDTNVLSADKLKISRSINKNFYNSVIYKYNEDSLEEKFLSGFVTIDEDSNNRIKVGNKPLLVESKGLRATPATLTAIETQSRRTLERFKYAAESVDVEVNYKTGFNMDVGDAVILDGKSLKMTDINTGTKNFKPRLMEIVNKSLNFIEGKIKLRILDTKFNLDGRYGVISPSSEIDISATIINLPLKLSYSFNGAEFQKWTQYIGQTILIHSPDFTFSEETVIQGFLDSRPNTMVVNPPLSSAPLENYIIDIPNYDNSSSDINSTFKEIYCSFDPQVNIAFGNSNFQFSAVGGLISIGSIVRVHSLDYSVDSGEVVVVNIVSGTSYIVDIDMGFTPDNTHKVDIIGFLDGGLAYRYI